MCACSVTIWSDTSTVPHAVYPCRPPFVMGLVYSAAALLLMCSSYYAVAEDGGCNPPPPQNTLWLILQGNRSATKKMINAQDGILQLNIGVHWTDQCNGLLFSTSQVQLYGLWCQLREQNITGVLNSNLHWRLVLVLPHNWWLYNSTADNR